MSADADNAIQRIIVPYVSPGGQDMTTSFQDILGSSYNFTPKSATSIIWYAFHHQISPTGSFSLGIITDYQMMVDGVSDTATRGAQGGVQLEVLVDFRQSFASWGLTPKVMKLQGRSLNSSSLHKFHATQTWEATSIPQPHDAILMIEEYETI